MREYRNRQEDIGRRKGETSRKNEKENAGPVQNSQGLVAYLLRRIEALQCDMQDRIRKPLKDRPT